jgi:hypothetical protein
MNDVKPNVSGFHTSVLVLRSAFEFDKDIRFLPFLLPTISLAALDFKTKFSRLALKDFSYLSKDAQDDC